ncbi:hypothetical protein G3M81_22940 [Bacillus paralicheniformis]|uniref:hypothetical protein n=1 Tax=Bacillus TaxID=1386 RepID=UPI0013EE435B|nr:MULTISPECIES: hypothetical protein [Bacillus]QII26948.1 hypothetical protein G3M80_20850 [Bacillus altitudinis]QII51416.1 hypothetical protein G3M81_22940 [Bacillus paralicheniformis]
MNFILQVVQFLLLLSILGLAYRVILLIFDSRTSKKFVLKGFLQGEEKKQDENKMNVTFLERVTSFSKYKAYLESELAEAKMNVSVQRFIIRRAILTLIIAGISLSFYFITDIKLYLYLTIPLAFVAYSIPKRTIKKNKRYFENQMKIELPEYLSAFAILLQNHTPFEATKKSIDYAGEILKPYVKELITQIELYPASPKPYQDFANALDMREAKEFIVALNQLMNVDRESADKIISDQIKIMDELQAEAFNEQIEARPDEVEKFITPMLFPLVAIIMTFLFVLIGDAFSQIN